jgi:hypothetical protein
MRRKSRSASGSAIRIALSASTLSAVACSVSSIDLARSATSGSVSESEPATIAESVDSEATSWASAGITLYPVVESTIMADSARAVDRGRLLMPRPRRSVASPIFLISASLR